MNIEKIYAAIFDELDLYHKCRLIDFLNKLGINRQ